MKKNNVKVILVCGVIKSGKDYYCSTYASEHPNERVIHYKFAEPIVSLASIMSGVDLSIPEVYEEWKKVGNNRQILVDIGLYLKSEFGETCLVERVINKIKGLSANKPTTILISDLRFVFEARLFQKQGLDVEVHFCNYVSEDYNDTINQPTERMAQLLSKLGIPHNSHWSIDEFMNKIGDILLHRYGVV